MKIIESKEFIKKIKTSGIIQPYEKLKKRIRKNVPIPKPPFDPFKSYWKGRIGKFRIIAEILQHNNNNILYVFEIFHRNSVEYEQFCTSPRDYIKNRPKYEIDYNFLETKLKKSDEQRKEIVRSVSLPAELNVWLYPPRWTFNIEDLTIYESKIWIEEFEKENIKKFWETFLECIQKTVDNVTKISQENSQQYLTVDIQTHKGRSIVYAILHLENNKHAIFLYKPYAKLITYKDEEFTKAKNFINTTLEYDSEQRIGKEAMLSISYRSYPYYLISDENIWYNIQTYKEANLALSPEEEILLNDVLSNTGLPVFINGRAGSGKSTMLFYIFATLCYIKKSGSYPGNLLYLTWSENLLESAKYSIKAILKSYHKFVEGDHNFDDEEIEVIINNSLFSYHTFLKNRIPKEERSRFSNSMYMNFSNFKKEFLNIKFGVDRSISAELAWHVIRVYIKGYFIDFEQDDICPTFDKDDFEELPRKEKTVTQDVFNKVYDQIWPWYKNLCQKNKTWDDQDLVRTMIMNDYITSDYVAIFIDEAQDLTKIDLQLVNTFSVFHKYDLSNIQNLESLPFAFAGDPLQTLNPTGFRWASLLSNFHDEVLTTLVPEDRKSLKLELKNLQRNYRSSEPIVYFCNLIQLIRKNVFDLKEIRPQSSHFSREKSAPLKYIMSENQNLEEIITNLKDTIIIIPCEEGQEEEYIQNDSLLKQLMEKDHYSESRNRILTASSSKGMEFPKVVLYKFGEAILGQLDKLITQPEKKQVDAGVLLQYEYFFNKLYVASSRAMHILIIIDTKYGNDRLWSPLFILRNHYLITSSDAGEWKDKIISAIEDADSTHLGLLKEQNPLELALEFRERGDNSKLSNYYKLAAYYYKVAGKVKEQIYCEAQANKIEGKFEESGKQFEEIGNYEEAYESFWRGHYWNALLECQVKGGLLVSQREALAEFMVDLSENSIHKFYDYLTKNRQEIFSYSEQWQIGLLELSNRLSLLNKNRIKDAVWLEFADLLQYFNTRGFPGLTIFIGGFYFKSENFREAYQVWKLIPNKDTTISHNFEISKAYSDGFPLGLSILESIGENIRIIDEWKTLDKKKIPEKDLSEWLVWIAQSYVNLEEYSDAINLLIEYPTSNINSSKPFTKALLGLVNIEDNKYIINIIDNLMTSPDILNHIIIIAGIIESLFHSNDIRNTDNLRLLNVSFLKKLAYSTNNLIDIDEKTQISLVEITNDIRAQRNWQNYISLTEMGAALESIGRYVPTLIYYENQMHIKKFSKYAKNRWISTKRRKIKNSIEEEPKDKTELRSKSTSWRIPFESISTEIVVITDSSIPEIDQPGKVETVNAFTFGNYEIKIQKQINTVLLTNLDNLQPFRLNIATGQIVGINVKQQKKNNTEIRFTLPASEKHPHLTCIVNKIELTLSLIQASKVKKVKL